MSVSLDEHRLGGLRWIVVNGPDREGFLAPGEHVRTELAALTEAWPVLPRLRAHVSGPPGRDRLGRRGRICPGAGQLPLRPCDQAVRDGRRPERGGRRAKSTLGAKAKQVHDLTKMDHGTAEFLRNDMVDASPMIWYIQVDGLIMDARELPPPVQAQAFELGVIPYIPALGPDGTAAWVAQNGHACR
jgi:hypothetical protein